MLFVKQYPLAKDDMQYNAIAANILQGKGFSYDGIEPTAARGPVYPFFLAMIYFIFGFDYNLARLFQAVISAFTCLLIYLIAKRVFNHGIGIFACTLTAFYPSLIGYTGLLYSETLTAFLLALVIFLYFLSVEKKSWTSFIITGVFLGLLILCYPKFLLFPVMLGFSMYFFNRFRKDFLKYLFALIIGVVITVLPWTLRNYKVFGKVIPVSTAGGATLWHSTLPQDDTEWHFEKGPLLSEFKRFYRDPQNAREQHEFLFSVRTNEILMGEAINNIKNNPLLFIKLSIRRFFRQWFASNGNSFYALRGSLSSCLLSRNYAVFLVKLFLASLHMSIIVFGCLGMIIDFNSDRKNLFSPVFLTIIYSSIISSIFMTQPRYQIPVLGLLFIYAAIPAQRASLRISSINK